MQLNERNYNTIGPYGIKPYGETKNPKGYRVIDALGRKITGPGSLKEAERLCDLLNDVFLAGSHLHITIH